jgi:MYXO-CTERM domain-containing protein
LSDYASCAVVGRAHRSLGLVLVVLLALAALATRRRD